MNYLIGQLNMLRKLLTPLKSTRFYSSAPKPPTTEELTALRIKEIEEDVALRYRNYRSCQPLDYIDKSRPSAREGLDELKFFHEYYNTKVSPPPKENWLLNMFCMLIGALLGNIIYRRYLKPPFKSWLQEKKEEK